MKNNGMPLQQIDYLLLIFGIKAHVSYDMRSRFRGICVSQRDPLANFAPALEGAATLNCRKKQIPLFGGRIARCISLN